VLLLALSQRGVRSLGMKPIAAGAVLQDGVWHNDDVDSLVQASDVKAPQHIVCPYLMQTPAALHIVAQREKIVFRCRRLWMRINKRCSSLMR
jgi:dethiobiotin synthetase